MKPKLKGRAVEASAHSKTGTGFETGLRKIAKIVFCITLFLATIRFGALPGTSLDSSWTEVLGWAALRHLQWGRDIVFTYGPLGFLHGNASYVPGILAPLIAGQVALTAAFVGVVGASLARTRAYTWLIFAFAFVCSYPWVPSDVAWALTLLFGAARLSSARFISLRTWALATFTLALASGAIALIKFSFAPYWLLGVGAVVVAHLLRKERGRALASLLGFAAAPLLLWCACSQRLEGIADYLRASFEIAAGYADGMSRGGPLFVDIVGVLCLVWFGVCCVALAWPGRREPGRLIVPALCAAAALVEWRATFTRVDHAHWFFAFLSLAPFMLLADVGSDRPRLHTALIALIGVCALAGIADAQDRSTRLAQLTGDFLAHVHALTDPAELQARREAQWNVAQDAARRDSIRARLGSATVDLFTQEQGLLLLNGLNYAPRPVFQSYSAYTPYLAGLNETYLLGEHAPKFVLMRLAAIDQRLPMSQDSLALIALLERYRPAYSEHDLLLLQRDEVVSRQTPVVPPMDWKNAAITEAVYVIPAAEKLVIAYVDVRLSWIGRAYALLLREPALWLVANCDSGERRFRLSRGNASTGFVLSPLIATSADWWALQAGMPTTAVKSFRIEASSPDERIFFDAQIRVGFQLRSYLRTDSGDTSPLSKPID